MTIKEFYHRVGLNGGLDREMEEWKIIDVHQVPKTLSEENEIDFYCCNDNEVFLLRLRNRATKKLDVVKDKNGFGYPTYLIAELPINTIDDNFIRTLLDEFCNIIR